MPLTINGRRVPPRWAERKRLLAEKPFPAGASLKGAVKIALVNNMPDPALEDTEVQFLSLLDGAAADLQVSVEFFCLPGVMRGERVQPHMKELYQDFESLLNGQFDGVIITGLEPQQPDLRQEPYWPSMVEVLDWAERHTASTVLSCLAAHAGVLYSDGIQRYPLSNKMFGVFDCRRANDHPLSTMQVDSIRFPHSRWNEVREKDLAASGYTVLTHSPEAGIDCFVKKKKQSLFVHFQGHPEYEAYTLFKEYRRDVRRFLIQERPDFPSLPHGYFDSSAVALLKEFQQRSQNCPNEKLMQHFPEAEVTARLEGTWSSAAIGIYTNWLRLLASCRVARLREVAVSSRPAESSPTDVLSL